MHTAGIIGGIGPMATAYLIQLIVQMTEAGKDQEHIPMVIYHAPQIPDRTEFLEGRSIEDPGKVMCAFAKRLEEQGADIIALPCITAHSFLPDIQRGVSVPVLDAVEESCRTLQEAGVSSAGILATDGTMHQKLFQNSLKKHGICPIMPGKCEQAELMRIIYGEIKAGKKKSIDSFQDICRSLIVSGAEMVILGCTELSLIKKEFSLETDSLDVMEVMSKKIVESCGTLKEEYKRLV